MLLLLSSLVEQGIINLNLILFKFWNGLLLFNGSSVLLRFNLTNKERAQYFIEPESFTFQAIIGLILGDLFVQQRASRSLFKDRKTSRLPNSRLEFGQSFKNILFLWHVFIILFPYVSSFPYGCKRFNKVTEYTEYAFFFNTMTLPCFNIFRSLFYEDGIKIIPKNINELVTLPYGQSSFLNNVWWLL
jgi:hypothetical protein